MERALISYAVEQAGWVGVYDERGHKLASIPLGQGTLSGYTQSTVNILRQHFMHTYDSRGKAY